MDMSTLLGVIITSVAGLAAGSSLWPIKISKLKFEHFWFAGMIPLAVVPWLITFFSVGNPVSIYVQVGWRPLVLSNLLAIGWGVANVLAGICTVRIGFTLCSVILTGMGVSVASITPMILKGTGVFENSPDLFSVAGLTILTGIATILLGVVLCAMAGFGREKMLKERNKNIGPVTDKSFLSGLALAVIAGILSAGPSLAFVYSQGPIISAMKSHGAGEISANLGFWATGFLGGALVNLAYPAWIMTRDRSWNVLAKFSPELLLASLVGSQLIVAFGLQGMGMIMLGALGASVGVGIQQVMQIIGSQGVGFISGEWTGIGGRPRFQMNSAVAVLIAAIVILVYAKVF